MSLLLLLGGRAGFLGAGAAVLSLSAPTAGVVAGPVVLQATPAVLTLSAPTATLQQTLAAGSNAATLTAPTATLVSSGTITLAAGTNVLSMSAGAAALSIDLTVPIVQIGGVDRTGDVRWDSLVINDALSIEQPNTCSFQIAGAAPTEWQEVVIALGAVNNKQFGGHIRRVSQVHEDLPANVLYTVECVDYTRLLNRRKVLKHYPSQSASLTIADLITTFTSGFTTANVAPGLPTIDAIDFDNEDVSRAIAQVLKLAGAKGYVDYDRDVHAFITETVDMPTDITALNMPFNSPALTKAGDIAQVRTRVIVEAEASQASVEVAPGATTLPVDDATPYASAGGTVKTGVQKVTYTGKVAGGTGSTVRSIDGPASAPTPAIGSGAGGVLGPVRYKASFKNSAGETVPGPASGLVTGVAFQKPTLGLTVAAAAGLGRLVGGFNYKTTFVTALGETDLGSVATSFSATAVAAPTAPSLDYVPDGSKHAYGHLVGAYGYKVTYVTQYGETTPSSAGTRTAAAVAPTGTIARSNPSTIIGALAVGASGYHYQCTWIDGEGRETVGGADTAMATVNASTLTPATPSGVFVAGGALDASASYGWKVSFIDRHGRESALSAATTGSTTGTNKALSLTTPVSSATGIVGRRIYRTLGGGSTYYLVAEIADNTTTAFLDQAPDENLGLLAPSVVTLSDSYRLSLPSGPTGTTARRLYRTKSTGGAYYFVGQVNDNGATTIDDLLGDEDLVDGIPLASTVGEQHTVTIPTGPTGTLARRIYRTAAGGADYKLLAEVQDNTTTTAVDNIPDSGLASQGPPLLNTAGGQNAALSSIPIGPTGTTARRVYRTKAGGTEYFLCGQISDNTTTIFTDSKKDEELGASSPLVNDAGASTVSLTSIPLGGTGITARRLYRTENGGSTYRFLVEIKDNTTTTYTDSKSDNDLGDVAPDVGTIGALAGDTSLRVESTSNFLAAGGWAQLDSQTLRYTGLSGGNTLTGIPSSGAGAIQTTVKAGVAVIGAPHLTGVPSGGAGAVVNTIPKGEAVDLYVQRDNTSQQAAIAALEGGDGVHEHVIPAGRMTAASAQNLADADLALFSDKESVVTFVSRDTKLRSGKSITVTLGAPTNISGTFTIQRVTHTGYGVPHQYPRRSVVASSYLLTVDDIFRRLELAAA